MKLPRAHHLSSEELAGQLIIPALSPGFMNRESPEARKIFQLVRKYALGGFILSGGHPADVRFWSDSLQRESKYPLFFAAKLGRGPGFNFNHGTTFPHLLCFGAAGDPELVKEYAAVVAKEARAIGLNLIIGPPLNLAYESKDKFVITDAFHHSTEVVKEMGTIFITEVQKYGIACTGKYLRIGSINQNVPNLQQVLVPSQDTDLAAFSEAAKYDVKGLLVRYLKKSERIKTSSDEQIFLKKKLRGEWKFEGVLFLEAKTLESNFRKRKAKNQLKSCFKAGIDLILDPPNIATTYELLLNMLNEDENFRKNVEQAVERNFRLKRWLHKHKPVQIHPNRIYKIIEHPNHTRLSIKVAEKGITLIRKSERYPLSIEKYNNAFHVGFSDFNDLPRMLNYFQQRLTTLFKVVHLFVNPDLPSIKDISSTERNLAIISLCFPATVISQSRVDFGTINKSILGFYKKKIPIILFIFGNPFIIKRLRFIEKTEAVFLTYSDVEASQRAAFKALIGSIDIRGKLPIKIGNP